MSWHSYDISKYFYYIRRDNWIKINFKKTIYDHEKMSIYILLMVAIENEKNRNEKWEMRKIYEKNKLNLLICFVYQILSSIRGSSW